MNQNLPAILAPHWRSARDGLPLAELKAQGHQFVVSSNVALPFRSSSIEQVITNNVPIDRPTWMGPGISSNEITRIVSPTGTWLHDGSPQP